MVQLGTNEEEAKAFKAHAVPQGVCENLINAWWVSTGHADNRKKKHCSWWCAAQGGKYELRAPNRILVVQLGTDASEGKVFRAHAAPQGLCENLINALKLLANQQRW